MREDFLRKLYSQELLLVWGDLNFFLNSDMKRSCCDVSILFIHLIKIWIVTGNLHILIKFKGHFSSLNYLKQYICPYRYWKAHTEENLCPSQFLEKCQLKFHYRAAFLFSGLSKVRIRPHNHKNQGTFSWALLFSFS